MRPTLLIIALFLVGGIEAARAQEGAAALSTAPVSGSAAPGSAAGTAVAAASAPVASTAPAVEPAAPAAVETGEEEEESAEARPAWLDKAEKLQAEAAKALDSGDVRAARKKLSKALRILAEDADEGTVKALKDDAGAVLSRAEDEADALPEPEETSTSDALDVTPQELSAAPVAASTWAAPGSAMGVAPDDTVVKKYISLYTGHPRRRASLQDAFQRMARHRAVIESELRDLGLPHELLYLPLVESEYQTRAVSRAGAVGLWQFMARTGRMAGLKINFWIDERLDPVKSTRAALRHLKDLHDWYQSWPLALAAYNRGSPGLERDLTFTRSPDFASAAQRGALPGETEQYVPKFMAVTSIAENAADYGFRIPPAVETSTASDRIVLPKPLDLKVAAQCAGTTEDEIRELNPVLRLWCTPKDETSFALNLPPGTADKTQACLALVKDWTPAADVLKYRVKRGDYLGRIASRYRTTIKEVMRENHLSSPKRLRVGQVLRIRPGRKFRQ